MLLPNIGYTYKVGPPNIPKRYNLVKNPLLKQLVISGITLVMFTNQSLSRAAVPCSYTKLRPAELVLAAWAVTVPQAVTNGHNCSNQWSYCEHQTLAIKFDNVFYIRLRTGIIIVEQLMNKH